MITPERQDAALLAHIAAAPAADLHLWWLGQSGFLVKWQDRLALLDPYLSDTLTEKYATADKPHIRMTARCLDPAALGAVAVATASHLHTDHLDAGTLGPLARAVLAQQGRPLPLVLPQGILPAAQERLSGLPVDWVPTDAGQSVEAGGFRFTAIPAAHNTVDRDAAGHCLYLGFIVEAGPWRLYHSGDTLWHAGLLPALLPHAPDILLVPVNGNRPERRVAGNLNGTEAAALAKACGGSVAIPHHFGMFTFNTENPDEFVRACARLGQAGAVLRNGGHWSSAGLTPRRSLT